MVRLDRWWDGLSKTQNQFWSCNRFYHHHLTSVAAQKWLTDHADFIQNSHNAARNLADTLERGESIKKYLVPGSDDFKAAFNRIISTKSNKEPMKRQERDFSIARPFTICRGEYKFTPSFMESIVIGGSACHYRPNSQGITIFYDTSDIRITNSEFGFYLGGEKKLSGSKFKLNGTSKGG